MAPSTLVPHSFVLADLFDVEAHSLDVPDHVIEADPMFDWIVCPACNGERWVEVAGSAWEEACLAWGRPDLSKSIKPCLRCLDGEVLDTSSEKFHREEFSPHVILRAA